MGLLKLFAVFALIVLVASAPADLEGSGDDGVRPRPDELEGSGDVTRPRPDMTTEAPRMKESRCKCFVKAQDMTRKEPQSHSAQLRGLMGSTPSDMMVTFADSDLGCQEAVAKCSAFCAGLGKQLSVSQLGSEAAKHGKWSTADWLCFKAKSDNPLSVQVVGRIDSCSSADFLDDDEDEKLSKSDNKSETLEQDDDDDEELKELDDDDEDEEEKHGRGNPWKNGRKNGWKFGKYRKWDKRDADDDDADEFQEVAAFTMTDSLCCKKAWKHYAATACA